jgi:hypothetical protein
MKILKLYPLLILGALSALTACDSDLPSDVGDDFTPTGYAEPLSDSEYQALSATEKYQVATKLIGTMYKGVPVADFFNTSSSLQSPQTSTAANNYLQDVRAAIQTDISNAQKTEIIEILASSKYNFSAMNANRPKEEPLALIHETPLSRNSFIAWMAHFLANTIMFSPAQEMESVDIFDVQNTYKRLVTSLTDRQSVRQIIRSHLPTLQRWRVARTPENAGIEGFELYLGLFDTIEDSKRVGKACQDLYLTDADDDYLLVSTNLVNTEPQIILQTDSNGDGIPDSGGYFITSCDDFYNVIAGHPLTIPRVCEVIINYLMAERTLIDRLAMCESIANSGATRFDDIFKSILFSKQYLLETERPKGFEEAFMSSMQAMKWDARQQNSNATASRPVWRNMASETNNRLFMGNMGWNTMTLKIGRTPDVPLDPLGFANYHKAVREELFLQSANYEGRNSIAGLYYTGSGNAVLPHIAKMSPEKFLHFLFLTALQRSANSTEINGLMPLINTHLQTVSGQRVVRSDRYDEIGRIVFDYASRLPEFYYFKRI